MTTVSQAEVAASLDGLRGRVDAALGSFLVGVDSELREMDPAASPLLAEIRRLLAAGGKRMRPAFCYWGFRAAPGPDAPSEPDAPGDPDASDGRAIVRAAAALELLHTMAIVHDDLMDEARTRRGVPSVHAHLESVLASGPGDDARRRARSAAILVGDLAAVLADRMFLEAGFDAEATVRALDRYHRMRTTMAAGQFLDVAMPGRGVEAARRAAALKGGEYSVAGPLAIGAALAGASEAQRAALSAFGAPLGEAFQLRDDLVDGEGAHGATPALVNALVEEARSALAPPVLHPEAVAALRAMADVLEMP